MEVYSEDAIKLLLALLAGTLVGAEREYRTKSAGLRTIILITLGSAVFTIISARLGEKSETARIAANIITGIGFLGAGVIFRDKSRISGLTTASTIWVAAGIGMGIGAGYYFISFLCLGLSLIVLLMFRVLQARIEGINQLREYKIVCEYHKKSLKHYEKLFRDHKLDPQRGKQSRIGNKIIGYWEVRGSTSRHDKVVNVLLNDPEVLEVDF